MHSNKLRRFTFVVVFLFSIGIAFKYATGPFLIAIATSQLKKAFPSSRISIKSCTVKPLHMLTLRDIEIEQPPDLRGHITSITAVYKPFELLKGIISSINVEGVSASCGSLHLKDARLETFSVHLPGRRASGRLFIPMVSYDKGTISELKADCELADTVLLLKNIYGRVFDGRVTGTARCVLVREVQYNLSLRFEDVDLARVVNDFDLKEKFLLSGALQGSMVIEGVGLKIEKLSGDFASVAPGGVLTVKDAHFLESMAQKSQQPLELVMESFKNYRYNTGGMKVYASQENLICDVQLEGEAGRKSLSIVLHDVFAQRRKP